jgi:hypothetical protein
MSAFRTYCLVCIALMLLVGAVYAVTRMRVRGLLACGS